MTDKTSARCSRGAHQFCGRRRRVVPAGFQPCECVCHVSFTNVRKPGWLARLLASLGWITA